MKLQSLAIFIAALIVAVACSGTKPDTVSRSNRPTYRDLIIKNYDEMLAMVKKHTVAAHKIIQNSENNPDWEHDARLELLQAERLILSRPDSDNMASKLIFEVRREISAFGNYDDLLESITKESIEAFNPDLSLPTIERTTYLFVLENLLAEMKSSVTDDARSRQMLEEIRDAKIKVPYEVMRERKLQGMFLTDSPSEEAQRILTAAGFDKK